MKAYVTITGVIFGLIAIAHGARVYAEGPRLLKEPLFVLLTVLCVGLSLWAFRLVRLCATTR